MSAMAAQSGSRVVRFQPALGDWIRENLDRGAPLPALVQAMVQQRMPAHAAHAIVAAFVRARSTGAAYPLDAVELPSEEAVQSPSNYTQPTPRMRGGASIDTPDRRVVVAARAERPALAVLAELTSPQECAELIEMARGRLAPSTVVDPATGRDVVTSQRSSFGMFFRPRENELVQRLQMRFAHVMGLPIEHAEGLQVLHYPEGAGSSPHFDFLVPGNDANRASIGRSGQRVSTLVAYLNVVEEGGETVFPAFGWAVSPHRGGAVCFEYANDLGEVDHASLHASSPVRRGEKWVATQWMRARPFVSADKSAGTQ